MRAAVILAALAIKSFIWVRTMTPRDAVTLWVAAFALLVLMLTIMGGRPSDPNSKGSGPFCGSAPVDYDGFQSCEFKLRDA